MKLTDKTIIHLTKPGRYSDGAVQGLHLWVKSPAKKYWILRFTYQAKRHDHSLGPYPGLSLSEARIKAVQLNGELNHHITPFEIKKRETNLVKAKEKEIPLFKDYAIQCIDAKRPTWRNLKHGDQWLNSLKDYAFPFIGNKKIDEITTEDILNILDPIWNIKTTTASRIRGRLEWILGSATTRGLRQGMNPAIWRGHLNTALGEPNKVSKPQHHAALPFSELPQFINELNQMNCLSALALEFTILTRKIFKCYECEGCFFIPCNFVVKLKCIRKSIKVSYVSGFVSIVFNKVCKTSYKFCKLNLISTF
jgi:hypothetical protein